MIRLRAVNTQDPQGLPNAFHVLPDLIVAVEETGEKAMGVRLSRVFWCPPGSPPLVVVVLDSYEEIVAKARAEMKPDPSRP